MRGMLLLAFCVEIFGNSKDSDKLVPMGPNNMTDWIVLSLLNWLPILLQMCSWILTLFQLFIPITCARPLLVWRGLGAPRLAFLMHSVRRRHRMICV